MKNFKRIPLENLYNCRDLGGYGTTNNGFFRFHKLYRSDSLTSVTENEWKTLYNMNVRTVIDLRSLTEQNERPYTAMEGISVLSLPFQKDEYTMNYDVNDKDFDINKAFDKSLFTSYDKMVTDSPERVANILNIIADALENGAVLFHCTAGKDRTGVLAALIYKICGVRNEDIVADYQVTEIYNTQNAFFKLFPNADRKLFNSDPINMETFLDIYEKENMLDLLLKNGYQKGKMHKLIHIAIEK